MKKKIVLCIGVVLLLSAVNIGMVFVVERSEYRYGDLTCWSNC